MKNSVLYIYIIASILLVGVGAFIGRKTVEVPTSTIITEIKWEKGEPIIDSIPYPVPYEVVKWKDNIVEKPIPTDTAALYAVWEQYYEQKKYNLDFSNDTVGVFKVDLTITQNSVSEAISTIEPYTRTIYTKEIIEVIPKLQFYVMGGLSPDLQTFKLQGGIDLKQKYMFGISAINVNGNSGYTIDVGYKF